MIVFICVFGQFFVFWCERVYECFVSQFLCSDDILGGGLRGETKTSEELFVGSFYGELCGCGIVDVFGLVLADCCVIY